jgi:coenzyme F420-reducing hydrogenase beta subunit
MLWWILKTSLLLATPISDPRKFPAKEHCSRCGLCETSFVANVTDACAFLPNLGMSKLDELEVRIHGRPRHSDDSDEARFGVLHRPIQLAKGQIANAQWTGVVTSIAAAMLESETVDAVVCIAGEESSWNIPQPILARTVEDVYRARGVKPSLAPSLKVLDEIRSDKSIRKLLFCGVGCAVQAFRTIQDDLGLAEVYVLGTNCADNSPNPEAATHFIEGGIQVSSATVVGYEFMQDYRVHVKQMDGSYIKRPYFSIPGTIAESAIAKSCLTCMDYTNGLADVVVGYMGAPLKGSMDQSFQTITLRNRRGAFMLETAKDRLRIQTGNAGRSGSFEGIVSATLDSDVLVNQMIGKTPNSSGLPIWLGDILATILSNAGPKGLNFAKYSIDYHILRNYFYILNEAKTKQEISLPNFAKAIIDHYLLTNPNIAMLEERIMALKG